MSISFTKDVVGEENDHPHHIGFWSAHGAVNGSDFWHGKDGCKVVTKSMSEPVFQQKDGKNTGVAFTVNLEWIGRDKKRVMQETRTYQISYGENLRAIDVTSELDASDGDVVFGDTKEGSFALRVAPTLRSKGAVAKGQIINSEGLTGEEAWGKRARWVAYHGPNWNDKQTVIALMDHPENINHPTRWHAITVCLPQIPSVRRDSEIKAKPEDSPSKKVNQKPRNIACFFTKATSHLPTLSQLGKPSPNLNSLPIFE